MSRSGFETYGRCGAAVVNLFQPTGTHGLIGGPVVRDFDIHAPELGQRLIALLDEAEALGPVTRHEALPGTAEMEARLGKRATNPGLAAKYWAIVTVTRRDGEVKIMTQLAATGNAPWDQPQESLGVDPDPDVLAEAYRRYWAKAEWNLVELGTLKCDPTFPRVDRPLG